MKKNIWYVIGGISLSLTIFIALDGSQNLSPTAFLGKNRDSVFHLFSWLPEPTNASSTNRTLIPAIAKLDGGRSQASGSQGSTLSSYAVTGHKEKRPAFLGGEEAIAHVTIGGKTIHLTPNQNGDFGRIYIGPKVQTKVTVSYDASDASDPVIIESEDGGVLNTKDPRKGSVVETGTLDGSGQINFAFLSGVEEGIYRVTLRKQNDLKQIDFWVGAEPPLKTLATANQ